MAGTVAERCGKPRRLTSWALAFIFAAFCGGCGGAGSAANDPEGREVRTDEVSARLWGSGDEGVVMVPHSSAEAGDLWPLAGRIGADRYTVLLLEESRSPGARAGAEYLRRERGVGAVAFVGVGAGVGTVLEAAREPGPDPGPLILICGTGETSGLGERPKLLAATRAGGLAGEAMRMAEEAEGEDNEFLLLGGGACAGSVVEQPGSERLMSAILEKLHEDR